MKKKSKTINFFIWILIFNYVGGYLSSLSMFNPKLIYNSLEKPSFAVPSFVFPIAWGILYFLLALAITLDYRKEGRNLFVYILSMIVNFSWSYIFFSQRLYGIAFFIIVVLIISSIYLGLKYFRNSKISSFIMLIYLIWLIYAGLLNYFIWMYNEM